MATRFFRKLASDEAWFASASSRSRSATSTSSRLVKPLVYCWRARSAARRSCVTAPERRIARGFLKIARERVLHVFQRFENGLLIIQETLFLPRVGGVDLRFNAAEIQDRLH